MSPERNAIGRSERLFSLFTVDQARAWYRAVSSMRPSAFVVARFIAASALER
jgi:hypothetical protein